MKKEKKFYLGLFFFFLEGISSDGPVDVKLQFDIQT